MDIIVLIAILIVLRVNKKKTKNVSIDKYLPIE